MVTNLIRAIVVAFTLLVNLARGKPRGTANTRATEHHDRPGALNHRSSTIRQAIAASDEILDTDRMRSAAPTLVTVS